MLRILRFLFTGDWHLHKWETIKENQVINDSGDGYKGAMYTMRCTECGNIKRKQVEAS